MHRGAALAADAVRPVEAGRARADPQSVAAQACEAIAARLHVRMGPGGDRQRRPPAGPQGMGYRGRQGQSAPAATVPPSPHLMIDVQWRLAAWLGALLASSWPAQAEPVALDGITFSDELGGVELHQGS